MHCCPQRLLPPQIQSCRRDGNHGLPLHPPSGGFFFSISRCRRPHHAALTQRTLPAHSRGNRSVSISLAPRTGLVANVLFLRPTQAGIFLRASSSDPMNLDVEIPGHGAMQRKFAYIIGPNPFQQGSVLTLVRKGSHTRCRTTGIVCPKHQCFSVS